MKKFIIILFFIILLLVGCMKSENNSDFDFSLSYNVNGNDEISTYENKFRVDTIEGVKEIDLTLSDEDMQMIKDKIIELSILEEDYTFKNYNSIEPCGKYKLNVFYDNKEYTIHWTSNNMVPFTIDQTKPEGESIIVEEKYKEEYHKLRKLNTLKSFIIDIIYKYEDVKELPEHRLYL